MVSDLRAIRRKRDNLAFDRYRALDGFTAQRRALGADDKSLSAHAPKIHCASLRVRTHQSSRWTNRPAIRLLWYTSRDRLATRYSAGMPVIILDTNAMPHGHFNAKTLHRLRAICGDNSSIVVPEVVVWEWAEHAHRAHVALNLAVEQHRVDPVIVPRVPVSPTPVLEEIVDAITRAFEQAGVEIWSPEPETWKDALRQQVLQVGSGETKKEVKTGAADAIVLACAEQYEYASEPPTILLSSDSKLRARAAAEVEDLLTANGTQGVLTQLNQFEPAPEDLEVRAAEVIPEVLNGRIAEGQPAVSFDEFGVELYGGAGRYSADFSIQPQSIDFERVDIVEFHDFEIARVGESRFGLGKMRIFGTFELAFLERRETSPGHFELVGDVAGPYSTGHVDVTVAIRWDLSWQFVDIDPTGMAVAVLGYDEEDEQEDEYSVPAFRATEAPGGASAA